MGYYVTLTDSQFVVPETPEVLAAIHEMETKYNDLKRGGGGGKSWFSWMPDLRTLTSVKDVFQTLGFHCCINEEGGVSLYGYDDKTGQESIFLAVVAPFVEEGSFTQWLGEEGEVWKYVVKDGKLHEVAGVQETKWQEPEPYYYSHVSLDPASDAPLFSITKVKIG